ncbi:MAG: endonuclease III [Acidimicrobiia bacterium]
MSAAVDQVTGPSTAAKRRARVILQRLKERYPDIGTALDYQDAWQLLVATVMSAQTTDETVNKLTPLVFEKYPSPADLAAANPEDVENLIFSSGFYRQKAKSIIALSKAVVERFDGVVPTKLDDLVTLPGVGRKTASVVLAEAFKSPAIAVDTHVKRVARRLDLTNKTDPVKIEKDLKALYPRKEWAGISMRVIQFGRDVCDARRPLCETCELNRICQWPGKRV